MTFLTNEIQTLQHQWKKCLDSKRELKYNTRFVAFFKNVDRLKNSYDDDISIVDDFLWPMRSKHCNTNGRSVWTARGNYFEKINLIWSPMNFSVDPRTTVLKVNTHTPIQYIAESPRVFVIIQLRWWQSIFKQQEKHFLPRTDLTFMKYICCISY